MQSSHQLEKDSILAIIITFNPDADHFVQFITKLITQFSNILVIDNNSENFNDCLSCLNGFTDDKIHIVQNASNIGLASAQNVGVKYALEHSFEAICIFDQDSDIQDDYLGIIVNDYNSLITSGNLVGTIGPCVVDRSSKNSYPISIYNGFFLKRYTLQENEVAECSYIISSGSLISLDCIKKVGPFLDELFINYIDIEWCFRASSKGYKIYTSNNTKLVQDVGLYRKMFFGRAIPVHNANRRYYAARNSVIMLFLPHISNSYKIREIIFNPVRLIFDCLVEGNSIVRIKLFLKGIAHGFQRK